MCARNCLIISLVFICLLNTKSSNIIKHEYYLYNINQINIPPTIKKDLRLVINDLSLDVYTTYDTPLNKGLEIQKNSTKPGYNSTIVIMGHSGIGNNVYFNRLYKLEIENKIQIIYSGIIYQYEVDSIETINKNQSYPFIFNSNYLYLITCRGKGKQLLIRAKMA